ncbi:DNA-binding protein, partial [Pseudomonas sp. FW305-33]
LEELRAWADRGACASTSDPNNANVLPAVRRPDDRNDATGGQP